MIIVPSGYEDTGRSRQKQRTRAALVASTRELISGGGSAPTVAEAAAVAGISRTTAVPLFPQPACAADRGAPRGRRPRRCSAESPTSVTSPCGWRPSYDASSPSSSTPSRSNDHAPALADRWRRPDRAPVASGSRHRVDLGGARTLEEAARRGRHPSVGRCHSRGQWRRIAGLADRRRGFGQSRGSRADGVVRGGPGPACRGGGRTGTEESERRATGETTAARGRPSVDSCAMTAPATPGTPSLRSRGTRRGRS